MAHRRRRTTSRLFALVLTAAALLLPGVAVLARQVGLLVHQCVAGDGAAGWLGLRLALLRTDGACPTGSFAVGGDGDQVISVVVLVALPVLLAHLAGLGLGLWLLAPLKRAAHAAMAVLANVLPRLPRDVGPLQAPVRLLDRRGPAAVLVRRQLDAPWRRGPPALRLA